MYQNDGQLRTAGLDPSDPPATLAEVRSAAEAIKAANIPGLDTPIVMRLDAWVLEYWTTGAGAALVNADNGHGGLATESRYDNAATREVLDWISQMLDDGLLKLTDNADRSCVLARATARRRSCSTAPPRSAPSAPWQRRPPSRPGSRVTRSGGGRRPGGVGLAPARLDDSSSGQVGGGWYIVDNGDPAQIAAWDF
jgi:ABC-type glycerol-3-phosphate transport system substrate-binding protein